VLVEQSAHSWRRTSPRLCHRWLYLVLGSALVLALLGTVPPRGVDVPSVTAQEGECGEVAAASCTVTVDEPRTAQFADPSEVHEWVGTISDPGTATLRVDVIIPPLPDALGEAAMLSLLAGQNVAAPVDVQILSADRSQLAGGSTSDASPALQLGAPIGVGIYVVQLRTQGEGSLPSYVLQVSQINTGAPSALPPPPGGCSSTFQAVRGFGMVYSQDARLRSRLGCPSEIERAVGMVDQVFQRGIMLWREDTRQIIVLRGENRSTSEAAEVYPDRFREGDSDDYALFPPPGLVAPIRGFGRLWRDRADIRHALGWAKSPERGFAGAVQQFQRGSMIWTGVEERFIWVIYDDGGTLIFRDLF
jgi:hypothetical protein